MFDIGGVELLVVAAIAILVVGPRELPGMLRGVGKFVRQAREMTSSVQRQFNDALKEAELDDVKKTFDDVRSLNPATQIRKSIANEMKPLTEVGDRLKTSGSAGSIAKVKTDTGDGAQGASQDAAKSAAGSTLTQSKPRVNATGSGAVAVPASTGKAAAKPQETSAPATKPAAKKPARAAERSAAQASTAQKPARKRAASKPKAEPAQAAKAKQPAKPKQATKPKQSAKKTGTE
jgi:sec-independent protein translocase protein TatB